MPHHHVNKAQIPSSRTRLTRKIKTTQGGILSEVFAQTSSDAAAVAFALSRIPENSAPILWVQDHLSRKESGRPYLPGLQKAGRPRDILYLQLSRPLDVLWALEDGLRCKALSAVIGEIWGDPPALSFTASKRLAMRAEASGTGCWLIRRGAAANLSAARDRWRVGSLPSTPNPHDAQAPGAARWQVELFRSRDGKPGTWAARHDRTTDRVDFSAAFRDGAMAQRDGPPRQRAAR